MFDLCRRAAVHPNRWFAALLVFLVASPAPTLAQQPAAPGASEAETLESIVVTARRREESLQDTPLAVTALSADALERQQIVGTTDLDKIARRIAAPKRNGRAKEARP